MLSVCIYCGQNKAMALKTCASCTRAPNSHRDVIHSIILCYSDTEPYLNFVSLEELEVFRDEIKTGLAIDIDAELFQRAEEAFSAVNTADGPKLIQPFAKISVPVITFILVAFVVAIFM
jgi:hypothetical protein